MRSTIISNMPEPTVVATIIIVLRFNSVGRCLNKEKKTNIHFCKGTFVRALDLFNLTYKCLEYIAYPM